jgi:hypothetical protein
LPWKWYSSRDAFIVAPLLFVPHSAVLGCISYLTPSHTSSQPCLNFQCQTRDIFLLSLKVFLVYSACTNKYLVVSKEFHRNLCHSLLSRYADRGWLR